MEIINIVVYVILIILILLLIYDAGYMRGKKEDSIRNHTELSINLLKAAQVINDIRDGEEVAAKQLNEAYEGLVRTGARLTPFNYIKTKNGPMMISDPPKPPSLDQEAKSVNDL